MFIEGYMYIQKADTKFQNQPDPLSLWLLFTNWFKINEKQKKKEVFQLVVSVQCFGATCTAPNVYGQQVPRM